MRFFSALLLSLVCPLLAAEEPYILKKGEFPPAGTAHEIRGELIAIDHVNRTGVLRPDRNDVTPLPFFDLPLHFEMLPYGSLSYHGAPAELQDIPIGTHLHGQFYLGEEGNIPPPENPKGKAYESRYSRVLLLEDDTSHYQRLGKPWKITAIDKENKKLTCTGPEGEKAFDFDASTRIWKGTGYGTLGDLAVGGEIHLNLTWVTQFGPGHILDIWADNEAVAVAAEVQAQIHMRFRRIHGLVAGVQSFEDEYGPGGNGIVTLALYGNVDPRLWAQYTPPSEFLVTVVNDRLRSYDQQNEFQGMGFLDQKTIENPPPGHSGIEIRIQGRLLAGYVSSESIRLYLSQWGVPRMMYEEALSH